MRDDAKAAARVKAKAARATAHANDSSAAEKLTSHFLSAVLGLDPRTQSNPPLGPRVKPEDGGGEIGTEKTVAAYLVIKDELDPAPLAEALHKMGAALCLPAVTAKDAPLAFRAWTPGAALEDGPFKTRQPPETAAAVAPDIVIVPLLAFDRQGRRLGYGGGYYDRTLAALRAGGDVTTVGLAYAAQEVDAVPADALDQSLDWVVTENEAIKIK